MSDEIRREFISRIEDLSSKISNHHNVLNLEAIWLFVATLGCWSVSQPYIQMLALILVFITFAFKVSKDRKYESSSSKIMNKIRDDLAESTLESDTKKARLHELDIVDKNLLGLKTIYKSTPIFLVGYGFWIVCLFYFSYNLLKK